MSIALAGRKLAGLACLGFIGDKFKGRHVVFEAEFVPIFFEHLFAVKVLFGVSEVVQPSVPVCTVVFPHIGDDRCR